MLASVDLRDTAAENLGRDYLPIVIMTFIDDGSVKQVNSYKSIMMKEYFEAHISLQTAFSVLV